MKVSRIDLISQNGATGDHYEQGTDYTNPPWNLRIKETKTTFDAPRFYWCFAYKGFRLCSELNYANEDLALEFGIKFIKEKMDENTKELPSKT